MGKDGARKGWPRLPLVPGPVTNGEFLPTSASQRHLDIAQETMARAEDTASRLWGTVATSSRRQAAWPSSCR